MNGRNKEKVYSCHPKVVTGTMKNPEHHQEDPSRRGDRVGEGLIPGNAVEGIAGRVATQHWASGKQNSAEAGPVWCETQS